MMILVAPVPWLVPGLPAWVGRAMLACAAIALAIFVAVWIAVGRIPEGGGATGSRGSSRGMHVVRSPRRLLLAPAR